VGHGGLDALSRTLCMTFDEHVGEAARQYLLGLLRATDNDITQAARIAGRNRTSFYRLMDKYGVSITRQVVTRRGNRGSAEWQALR
jgi:DNA-binding NtrC family response regulator